MDEITEFSLHIDKVLDKSENNNNKSGDLRRLRIF